MAAIYVYYPISGKVKLMELDKNLSFKDKLLSWIPNPFMLNYMSTIVAHNDKSGNVIKYETVLQYRSFTARLVRWFGPLIPSFNWFNHKGKTSI